ncbi:MAG: hypothetical protein IKS88_00695, partial [Clostridia bacterium]|nr:hypothetical protein [Clostridia bacterium]
MKKTLSMLLAVLFALTAFGATALFGGVLGASAVFYDYYEYTSVPGFTAFTAEQITEKAWMTSCNFSGFSSDYLPDGNPVDKVATFTCTTPDKYSGMVFAPMELANSETAGLDSCIWGALDTIGGKDFLGNSKDEDNKMVWETSLEGCAGFCFWIGVNGGHYDGSVKIQLFAIPCTGPYYKGSNDGTMDLSNAQYGFVYECDGLKADEDGYVYYDFKTDFWQCDWWSKDEEGINHFRGADPIGNPEKYPPDKYAVPSKTPIPQTQLPYINGIQIRCGGVQAGDVISIGDWRIYKDTRIHPDELEEQCDVFYALDPEAYTEESYDAALTIYLDATEMLLDPSAYTQKQIDDKAKELKHAIRDLQPMFKAEMKSVKLAGFEVWDDDDFDEFECPDTATVEEDVYPYTRDQSVMIFANAQPGAPYYGWSLFTNGIDEDEDEIMDSAIKNPFELLEGSAPLSDASGIRFWIKWDEEYFATPPSGCLIGLGSSEEGVYFECESTAVDLPKSQGYVGVAWSSFYDMSEEEADIYDYIDSLDYIVIRLEGGSGIFYISDLTGFEWRISSADFEALQAEITSTEEYLDSLVEAEWFYKSWDRVVNAVEYAKTLLGKYGVTEEEAYDALTEIQDAKNDMRLVRDLARRETMNELEGLYKSGKTYWRGNVTAQSYNALREELDKTYNLLEIGPHQDEAEEEIAALKTAISGLKPIKESGRVTTIFSFESYTKADLLMADGDRTQNVKYELDKNFEKLPEDYNQALKMTAQVDMGSSTTDQHGMMQFKAMYRDNGNHVIPIKLGKNDENLLIGDLTGTDGLCLWVGVNDMNLVQNCTMRVAVSNCTVSNLFERATVDIPVPANGQGWLYLPWEYFEYYDDWTHGEEINLAKIYFYIIRFDGEIKAGLEVYVTGIYAYISDSTPGTWATPVVSNIIEGAEYDVSEQDLIPDWDVGAAMLDGEFLIYGNPVVKSGDHTLVVTNGNKSSSVNFTVTGGIVEAEQPVVAGVENGGRYEEAVAA